MKKVMATLISFVMIFCITPFAFAEVTPTPIVHLDENGGFLLDYSDTMDGILSEHKESGGNNVDITVSAMVEQIGGGPTYKIQVSWGNMEFVYQTKSGMWDPDVHKYIDGTSGEEGSWATTCLGNNNIITITNHSAFAIASTFDYNAFATAPPLPGVRPAFSLEQFNTTMMNTGLIGGIPVPFAMGGLKPAGGNVYWDWDDVNNKDNIGNGKIDEEYVTKAVLYFPTADEYGYKPIPQHGFANDERSANIYFSLIGKPSATSFGFASVGEILIDFYPFSGQALNNNPAAPRWEEGDNPWPTPVVNPSDGSWN
jgi:hypothetical protein